MPNTSSHPPPDWRSFAIEKTGASKGVCDCCGTTTKRVWGLVRQENASIAAYFASWTENKPDHGATFDLVLGTWGESTTPKDRYAVALDFRIIEGAPQFMVVDPEQRATLYSELASTALRRAEVIGTVIAPQVFAIVDAVYIGESELDEIRRWTT